MNESVIDDPGILSGKDTARVRRRRYSGALYGYLALAVLAGLGWALRDRQLVSPEAGLGYWLGIIGGSLMLTLLL